MLAIKSSLLLLYLRIFAPDKVTRYVIYCGLTFCFLAYTALMFLDIFVNAQALVNSSKVLGVVNLTSDIYILCVPIAAVAKLQLSLRQKIGVLVVFMTGIMCEASSSGRRSDLLTFSQSLCYESCEPYIPIESQPRRTTDSRRYVPPFQHYNRQARTIPSVRSDSAYFKIC